MIFVISKEDAFLFNFFFFSPEINDSEGHPSSSHQTLKGTSKWATSLESLLEDPEGVKRFRVAILNMDISVKQNQVLQQSEPQHEGCSCEQRHTSL